MSSTKKDKKRKWDESYVRYGFTYTTDSDGTQRPQCFLCSVKFSNANLKPSKLNEHFQNQHGGLEAGTDLETLQLKRARFDRSGTLPKLGFVQIVKPLLYASYQVAYQVAKCKKPHSIAEELIKPCALQMAKLILGIEAERKLQQISLSNDVIHERIDDMSQDILEQTISDMKVSAVKVSLQLDESTDVSNCSQLLVFVRYVKGDELEEQFLFCESLKTTTKAIDVFNIVKDFFTKQGLELNLIGSVCTDGAPSMLGNKSGFGALLKKEIPGVQITHCVLHRHALASKSLPQQLKQTLDNCVKIVNAIRSRALHHRLFQKFCEEVGQDHSVLLYHTEVRWLSRGRVLSRVFELREEILHFFRDQENQLAEHFENEEFLQMLGYLADIFSHLNSLSLSLQGKGLNIVVASEKLDAFKGKLSLWSRRIKIGNLSNFPLLDEIIGENGIPIPTVIAHIIEHLEQLQNSFAGYFSVGELQIKKTWIRDPFLFRLEDMDDNEVVKECLIELRSNQRMRMEFQEKELHSFWASQMSTFPTLAAEALGVLVPFATTYLCEAGFSAMVLIKTKQRNRLNPQNDMRVALSTKIPRFDQLVAGKQQQKSH